MTTTTKTKTTKTAECQVCARVQATKGGVLVHHGYKRPGVGEIVGDCYGVGHAPFPAHDALDAAFAMTVRYLESAADALAAFEGFERTAFVTHEERRTPSGRVYDIRTTHYAVGVTVRHDYVQAHARWIGDLRTNVRLTTGEVARLERRIAEAKRMQAAGLSTESEELRAVRATDAATLAAKAAAKAERAAVKAAKDARRVEREAKAAAREAAKPRCACGCGLAAYEGTAYARWACDPKNAR